MKAGVESQTSVLVCMARAAAHGKVAVGRFADPTALTLLPAEARRRLEGLRTSRSLRARLGRPFFEARAKMMAVRTIAIDDAVRAAGAPQVVILGAGLDGRAWRMPELASATVFEVDHPDTQQAKRARLDGLVQHAREVRFVPVDFTRDSLDEALASAGHDPGQPTCWIWEGVVMYLERSAIDATMRIVGARSAAGSTLAIAYIGPPAAVPWAFRVRTAIVGLVVRRLGEPFRSTFTAAQMRDLLEGHGWQVRQDQSLPELAAPISAELARECRRVNHLRIVTARR